MNARAPEWCALLCDYRTHNADHLATLAKQIKIFKSYMQEDENETPGLLSH